MSTLVKSFISISPSPAFPAFLSDFSAAADVSFTLFSSLGKRISRLSGAVPVSRFSRVKSDSISFTALPGFKEPVIFGEILMSTGERSTYTE